MKKFFVLLLIVTLAAFVFTGCTPPAEGEGEGEGEGEPEVLGIVVEGAVTVGSKVYVKGGKAYDITVTFDTPRNNVQAAVTDCVGDLSKDTIVISTSNPIPLWPSADRKVWTGNYIFDKGECVSDCCVTQIYVSYGECDTCYVVSDPIIVDSANPKIGPVEICIDNCTCAGCSLVFKSDPFTKFCADDVYCKDDCSGFAGWTVALYEDDPFDKCCDTPCEQPICEENGDCRVEWTSCCLKTDKDGDGEVYVLVTFMDNVGHTVKWLAFVEYYYDKAEDECVLYAITPIHEKTKAEKYCTDTPEFRFCKNESILTVNQRYCINSKSQL